MKQKHIEKIKSKGYWRIHFKPKVHVNKLETLKKCFEIVEANSQNLTGWDYPHIPKRSDDTTGIDAGNNYYQGWIDWKEYGHLEFWRMYQSGQFIHYFGLIEDWNPMRYQNIWEDNEREPKSGEMLGVTRTTYFITNVYQFLSKLALAEIYNEGIELSISLINTEDRQLIVDHSQRLPFSYARTASVNEITFIKSFSKEELVEDVKEMTINTIIYFFERFKWDPPNKEVIKLDYDNLLNGKL